MAIAVMVFAALGLLALPVFDLVQAASLPAFGSVVGIDVDLYIDAARRWLATGQFYEAYQLNGSYQITLGDILYPPVALVLFVPFVVLPGVLWWVVPLALWSGPSGSSARITSCGR